MAVKLTSSGLQSVPDYKPSASDITKKSTTKKRTSGGGGSSSSSQSNAVQTLANVSGKEITTTDGKTYSPQSTIPISQKLLVSPKIKSSSNQSSSGGVYINPITKQGVSLQPGAVIPKGMIKEQQLQKFINQESILRGLKMLTTTRATDPFYNIKQVGTKQFRENLDLLSGGEYSRKYFDNLQSRLNNQVNNFNKLYSGRTLTQEEYDKASEIAREIEYAQKVIDGSRGRITGFTERVIKSDLLKNDKLRSIAFGVVSAGAGALVSASQTPEQLYSLLRNPSKVKDIPSNFIQGIKDSVNQNIQYIAINPYFGIARIATQAGIIYVTGKLSAQGLKLLKQIRPGATKSLFKKLSKVAKKNISKVNINIRKVFQKGKISGYDIDISGIGKGKITGKARSFAISQGKDKSIAISWGGIIKEGKFVQGKVKKFISVGKSEGRKITSKLYESAGKGKTLAFNKRYLSSAGKVISEYNLDEYVTNSISRQLNRRLASFIGKSQSSARTGLIFSGYVRDVSKSLTRAIVKGSANQLDEIYKMALDRFKKNMNIKISSKVVSNQFDNQLKLVMKQSTAQALKDSSAVINSVAGAVARVQNKLPKRALKNVSNSAVKNTVKIITKKLTSSLIKGASVLSVVNALQSAQAQKSIARTLQVQLQPPQAKSGQRQVYIQIPIPKLAVAQKQAPVPRMARPSKMKVPTVPIYPTPSTTIRLDQTYPNKVKNIIRVKNGYLGYVVVGKSARRFRTLTRIPISFDSSLNIASYFAIHSPTGYSILSPSNVVVSKEAISRYPRVPKDYYFVNKNKLQIIKRKRSIIIKRK